MKKYSLIILIVISFSFLSLKAQETTKNKKIEFSFSERIRLTTFDNAISLNDAAESWSFSRFRTTVGVKYSPNNNILFNLKLGNESRIWLSPESKNSRFDETFVDQLYFKWNNIAKLPLEITAGRQNIMLDEGFICLDAQPMTGSRSAYFNAFKGVYAFDKKKSITAFISYIPKTDNLLPIINEVNPSQFLEEQSNTGIGLYYKYKIKNANISIYYFNKSTHKNDAFLIENQTNALGARISLPLIEEVKFITEAAYQFGKSGDLNINAFGGYFHLDYTLNEKTPILKTVSLGGFYLSGDDPTTTKVEAWDPLWSRWPKWSESYIYTLIVENGGKVAYWSNIASLNISVNGQISEKVSFKSSYYHLLAVEDNYSAFCDGEGKTRGGLFTLKLNYKIDENWSGHFLWESFKPGNFYPSSADGYNWLRFELMYKI